MDVFISRDDDDRSVFSSSSSSPGNVAFGTTLLQAVENGYHNLQANEKSIVAYQVLHDWKTKGGRFLDAETNIKMGDEMVRKKILRVLRMLSSEPQPNRHVPATVENDLVTRSLLYDSLRTTSVERTAEQKEIIDCYDRCCSGKPTTLFVHGPSGVGKSHLIQSTLKKRVERDGGSFLIGSFDLFKQPEPYHGFREAFEEYPGAAEIFDSSTKEAESPSGRLAFVTFFKRLKTAGIVVLVLNNVENAGACTLAVLKRVLSDLEQSSQILVIVTSTSPGNDQVDLPITPRTLSILPLTEAMLGVFLERAWDFHTTAERLSLASLLYTQTQGNMLLILELLFLLVENSCISLTEEKLVVDQSKIDLFKVTCPADILSFRLPSSTTLSNVSEMVRRAACFGRSVPIEVLVASSRGSAGIDEAVKTKLIYLDKGKVVFAHGMIQRVVYDSMRPDEKELAHLSIGRRLSRKLIETDDSMLFTVLQQFMYSKMLVTDPQERHSLARLCLKAGRSSASVSAFHTASEILELGIGFLGDTGWRDQYDLTLACYNLAAEVYLCSIDLEAADRMVAIILQKARNDNDCFQAEITRLYSLGTSNRQNEAIDAGLDLLQRLGETFPRRNLNFNTFIELARVGRIMKGKTDEALLSLPPMQDAKKLHCMQILNLIFLHAMLVRPPLTAFISLKSVQLTIRYGLSLMAPQAFTLYGWTLSILGRYDEAYRFGSIGVKLLERLGQKQSLPRVYATFYGIIYPLHRHMHEVTDKFLEGQRVGLLTGDYEFASINATMYVNLGMYSFVPLPTINKEFLRIRSELKALGQETTLRIAIQNLMSSTGAALSSGGELFDFEGAYLFCVNNDLKSLSTGISTMRMLLCCISNDFQEALIHTERCFHALEKLSSVSETALSLSLASVVYLENARNRSLFWKRKAKRTARRTVAFLKIPSLNCPGNFLAKSMLVQAELDAFCGRQRLSLQKFFCAIETSRSFLWGSFCRERAARYLFRCGRLEESKLYFEEARQCCVDWGATAKVDLLRQEIHKLFPDEKQ